MRKLTKIAIAFIAIVSLNACTEDDEFTFTAKEDPTGLMFTSSAEGSYTLSPANGDNLAERFVWNAVDFGVQTPVNYELQGAASESFEAMTVVAQGTETNGAVTVTEMMEFAEEAGLDNDPTTAEPNTGTIYFRVRAYVGSDGGNVVDQYSNVISVNVNLPEQSEEEDEDLPKIYVTGNFLAASGYGTDWTATDGVPIAAEAEGNTVYEGFVYMNVDAPQFKILQTNENFDGNLGDAGDADGVYTGVLETPGVNAGTPDGTGGYYLVNVDTGALTYELTETTWGVIGNATPSGWDSDTDMTYDPDTQTWSVTLELTEQEATDNGFKFRANDAWDLNLGDTDADGSLEFAGDNIGVPEDGNYTITLDLSNPRQYRYSISRN
ncbi:SusE domain-containing protein [Autumnicola edwardsiae]|uniref:SusE domain-containing protein n=1 Tax=Autumnicola edwardsiae TaxID=3075594 RepID=A0ABU3CVH2_9FLAO|nr:SusE domain-containing protein [Zunongwangia sp. F297]MDT0649915.1 SusE domain-containing protein [Zunongwangia sp. F297]